MCVLEYVCICVLSMYVYVWLSMYVCVCLSTYVCMCVLEYICILKAQFFNRKLLPLGGTRAVVRLNVQIYSTRNRSYLFTDCWKQFVLLPVSQFHTYSHSYTLMLIQILTLCMYVCMYVHACMFVCMCMKVCVYVQVFSTGIYVCVSEVFNFGLGGFS